MNVALFVTGAQPDSLETICRYELNVKHGVVYFTQLVHSIWLVLTSVRDLLNCHRI